MNYYAAKFQRQAKPDPRDWLIVPNGRQGDYILFYVGVLKDEKPKR